MLQSTRYGCTGTCITNVHRLLQISLSSSVILPTQDENPASLKKAINLGALSGLGRDAGGHVCRPSWAVSGYLVVSFIQLHLFIYLVYAFMPSNQYST